MLVVFYQRDSSAERYYSVVSTATRNWIYSDCIWSVYSDHFHTPNTTFSEKKYEEEAYLYCRSPGIYMSHIYTGTGTELTSYGNRYLVGIRVGGGSYVYSIVIFLHSSFMLWFWTLWTRVLESWVSRLTFYFQSACNDAIPATYRPWNMMGVYLPFFGNGRHPAYGRKWRTRTSPMNTTGEEPERAPRRSWDKILRVQLRIRMKLQRSPELTSDLESISDCVWSRKPNANHMANRS